MVVVILTFDLVEPSVSFNVPLKDTTVPEENSVVLECEVSQPGVKPKWLKDGKEIKPDKKKGITTKADGRKLSLTIPSALAGDTGQYSVQVGDEKTECKVSVKGKPMNLLHVTHLCM